jgi:hypothetical protein
VIAFAKRSANGVDHLAEVKAEVDWHLQLKWVYLVDFRRVESRRMGFMLTMVLDISTMTEI